MSEDYKLEQIGDEIDYLSDDSKLTEAFALAKSGRIAYVEELLGRKYVIMTEQKFNKLFDRLQKAVDKEEAEQFIAEANEGSEDE